MDAPEHARLAEAINAAMREFVTRTVLFHQAVAQAVGLTATDLQCLNLLLSEGPMTPGQLAANSGLTTGAAITGAVDRLQRAGYVHRANDPTDRRKVLVQPDHDRVEKEITPLYDGIGRWHDCEIDTKGNDQLAAILDYLTNATRATHTATHALRRND